MKKFIAVLFILISIHAHSQPDLEDGDGTVPVDGGLSLLLTAGAAYGARRVMKRGKGKPGN